MQDQSNQELYWNVGGPHTYSQADIDSAIAAGILSAKTAALLKNHVLGSQPGLEANEEHFRLVSGFNDIFVVLACLMVLTAISWLTEPFSSLSVALIAWGLSEYFVRLKHLSLTAIVLLIAFVSGIFMGVVDISSAVLILLGFEGDYTKEQFIGASFLTAVAAWFHWKRFFVPITVASGIAACISFVVTTLLVVFPSLAELHMSPVIFCSGVVVLVLAMKWDSSDTARQTRRSDVAFWLHLLAAPLLVHPIFMVLGVFDGQLTPLLATVVVAVYAVLAFISLCLDRRALMVSSLFYVLYAFGTLFKEYGLLGLNFAASALVIGLVLLLLAAFWPSARIWSLQLLPQAWLKKLPPATRKTT